MIGTIVSALVPVFVGLTLGYSAGRRGIVEKQSVAGLNTFVVSYAMPAALFLAAAQMPRQALLFHAKLFLVVTLSILAAVGLILAVEVKLLKFTPADTASMMLTASSPNWVAVGIPVFVALYGPQGTMPVAVAIVAANMVAVPLTLLLLETEGARRSSAGMLSRYTNGLLKSFKNAIVLAPLVGMGFSLAGFTLSPVWVRSAGLLADSAAGAALFVTGIIISGESVSMNLNVFGGLLLKLMIQPVLTFVIASWLLHYPSQIVRDSVLLMACPSGFVGILLAVAFRARTREAESVLLLSTGGSAITLAIVILLLPFIR